MKKIWFVLLLLVPVFAKAQIITRIAGVYSAGYSGNGGPATNAKLRLPNEVSTDLAGNIYIAEYGNHIVRKIDPSGIINVFAGTGIAGYSGDGGQATNAKFSAPSDIAIDVAGNVYISDIISERIRKVDTFGIVTTVAGNGIAGYSGDGGPATNAKISGPFALYIDGTGNIYVADAYNNCIRRVDTFGVISTIAGVGTVGYSGDGGPATAALFNFPNDVVGDNRGNLYVNEYGNCVVRKIDSLGIISTVAGTGAAGFFGDGGPATNARLDTPYSVCTDAQNNLYITDNFNERIRRVDTFGTITTIAGTGMMGNTGDGGPATAATFNNTGGITFDVLGNMLIADFGNNAIRKIIFNPSSNKIPMVTAGLKGVYVYPNPATHVLTITALYTIATVSISNLLGQTMYRHEYNASTVQVDVADLPAGVYLACINGTEVRKFVKQ